MLRSLGILTLVVCTACTVVSAAEAGGAEKTLPIRTWTSADGKFRVTARLAEVQAKAVVLEKEDGSLITVPRARLSRGDLDYVQRPPEATSPGKNQTKPAPMTPKDAITPRPSYPGAATEAKAPPSYEEARQASWILASVLIETLEKGDAKQWPGTHAWLKDLREQTKDIDKNTPVAKWPEVDIGKLVDHNPNFWRMYYEVAPGDPALTLIHASLLLSQGEAMRAGYILELGQHWPGIPKEVMSPLRAMQATAMAALKASNARVEVGTQRHDQRDYDGAITKYREALNLCPQNGWASYELGYTLRTKAQIARGEPVDKPGTVKINDKLHDSPEVTAAFAEARRHDPLQFMAYQGSDPEVIKGCMAMGKKVMPAWKALREKGITKEEEYHALKDLSEGFRDAGVYDLALFARQLMAARRNSYDPEDYPIIAVGLRKLSPGDKIEEILTRLRGGKGRETAAYRTLIKPDEEVEQPVLGSGERLYMPDKPPPKSEANKPVHVDHVRLLTSEKDIFKRTTVEDFAKFSKEFDKIADEILGKCETPCKILVQFTCTPSAHTVKIMHQPKDVDEKPLKEMYKAIGKMDKLQVKEDTVEFQIQLTVTPKNKLPDKEK